MGNVLVVRIYEWVWFSCCGSYIPPRGRYTWGEIRYGGAVLEFVKHPFIYYHSMKTILIHILPQHENHTHSYITTAW